jgi:hypothetical protein
MYSIEANNALRVDRGANFMLKLSRKVLLNELDREMKYNFAKFFAEKLRPALIEKNNDFFHVKIAIKNFKSNHNHSFVRLDYQNTLDFYDIPALFEIASFAADLMNPREGKIKPTQVLDEMVTCLKEFDVFTIRTFLIALSFLRTIRNKEFHRSKYLVRTEEFDKIRNIFREIIIFFTKFRDSNNNGFILEFPDITELKKYMSDCLSDKQIDERRRQKQNEILDGAIVRIGESKTVNDLRNEFVKLESDLESNENMNYAETSGVVEEKNFNEPLQVLEQWDKAKYVLDNLIKDAIMKKNKENFQNKFHKLDLVFENKVSANKNMNVAGTCDENCQNQTLKLIEDRKLLQVFEEWQQAEELIDKFFDKTEIEENVDTDKIKDLQNELCKLEIDSDQKYESLEAEVQRMLENDESYKSQVENHEKQALGTENENSSREQSLSFRLINAIRTFARKRSQNRKINRKIKTALQS